MVTAEEVSFYFGADDKPRIVRPSIRESAPKVDTASATAGVEINQEVLKNTPVRGHTFESIIALAPGAADVAPRVLSSTGSDGP